MSIRFRVSKRRNIAVKSQFALTVFLLCTALPGAQDTVKRTREELHHLHQDAKAYIAFLEDPQRDAYQKPNEVISALELREGEVIADVGAGSGYFSLRLANAVGEQGRVYAVDISPDMIRYLNRRIRDFENPRYTNQAFLSSFNTHTAYVPAGAR